FYGTGLMYWVIMNKVQAPRIVRKFGSFALYFIVGNIGSFLGLFDFLRGKSPVKWDPIKQD
ncbi:MAG: hypothetical protein Q8Q33_00005, partial [Chlamydiota bacterium]|nr:hypothetical protein [Chlamydiota bacterium]